MNWLYNVHANSSILYSSVQCAGIIQLAKEVCEIFQNASFVLVYASRHSILSRFYLLMSPYCRWNPTDNIFSSCGLQIRLFMYKIFGPCLVYGSIAIFRRCLFNVRLKLQHYPIVVYLLLTTINTCLCGLFMLHAVNEHIHTQTRCDQKPSAF